MEGKMADVKVILRPESVDFTKWLSNGGSELIEEYFQDNNSDILIIPDTSFTEFETKAREIEGFNQGDPPFNRR